MKQVLTHLLVVVLIAAPVPSLAQTTASTNRPLRDSYLIRGEPYLTNCPDILNVSPADYEKTLVDSAKTEGQALQLLYDGGLVFSRTYVQAFLYTLGTDVEGMKEATKQFYGNTFDAKLRAKLRKFAQALVSVAELPTPELNQFIWAMLESEQTAASVSGGATQQATQVRFHQVSSLIAAIKASPNRPLFEQTLRDVISQSLLQSAATIMRTLDENYRHTVNWKTTLAGSGLAGLIVIFMGAVIIPRENMGQALPVYVNSIAGAFVGMPAIKAVISLRNKSIARNLRNQIKAINKERVVFVLPKGSGEERMKVANLLKEFLKLDENKPTRYQDPNMAVTVADACQNNTCLLSPVQLVEVGAVDLLELEALFQRLRDTITAPPATPDDIQKALTAVVQDPNSYGKAMVLRAEIKKYSDNVTAVYEAKLQLLNDLDGKIKKLKDDFAILRNKPFEEIRPTEEDQARGLLLQNRASADLAQLDRLIWDVNNFKATLDLSKHNADIANGWLKSLPLSFNGWSEAAENILQQLDQLEAQP